MNDMDLSIPVTAEVYYTQPLICHLFLYASFFKQYCF